MRKRGKLKNGKEKRKKQKKRKKAPGPPAASPKALVYNGCKSGPTSVTIRGMDWRSVPRQQRIELRLLEREKVSRAKQIADSKTHGTRGSIKNAGSFKLLL